MFLVLQAVQPDTVVMVPARDAFDYIQAGTIGLVVVILILLLMILVRVLQTVEALSKSVDPLVDKATKGLDPVLERARSVSENVDYVSHAIRRDVEGLTEALDRVRGRLDQASDRMEERIEEFNALMELVQSEAEEIFLDTASTVRGFREGTRSLSRSETRDVRSAGDSASPIPGTGAREGELDGSTSRGSHGGPRAGTAAPPGSPVEEESEDATDVESSGGSIGESGDGEQSAARASSGEGEKTKPGV